MTLKFVIPRKPAAGRGPQVRAVCTPKAQGLLRELGNTHIRRASHVEPFSGLAARAQAWLLNQPANQRLLDTDVEKMVAAWREGWFADLLPVDGPVLGPFADSEEAKQAELQWLDEHHIPAVL